LKKQIDNHSQPVTTIDNFRGDAHAAVFHHFIRHHRSEGIRHLDKSNWSGYGVVFNKELFHQLKHEPGFSQAGIYILVGNASEETIYIGEADPVGDRLKNHVANKEGWVWGVYLEIHD
jgi:hypothetical protein